jgi:tetratricopeptide (TPR) repeat protein
MTSSPPSIIASEAELDPKLLNLWKRALLACEQLNWEYVINLALPVVKASPTFLNARLLLRRAEGEFVKQQKKSLFGGGMSISFKSQKKDPLEAINDLEDNVFQKDPFNIKANQEFYELAMRANLPELAAIGLETIRAGHPNNLKAAHHLAEHYMTQDMPEKAGDVYRSILKQDPRDMGAIKGEKDAAARQSIKRGNWEMGFQDAKKDAGEANKQEMLLKQGMTREQMDEVYALLYADYEANPTDLATVKNMGGMLEKMESFDQALDMYNYALSLNPSDVSMQRKIDLLNDKVQDLKIAELEAAIESEPDAPDIEERRNQLIEVKQQRGQKAVIESRVRVDRNPTDKGARFDLGQAYYNAGMYGEAIPELQQARQNPNLRTKALYMLGMCFASKNMNDLAVGALGDAAKEISVMDNTKKDILYSLAMLHEKMGRKEDYLEALKEIYNQDYGYKDVAKRVEASYG